MNTNAPNVDSESASMEKSNLDPFVRKNLDILFVGLNPAKGSSRNRHYFSVNQAFWNQLYDSGLITTRIDKSKADDCVFGQNDIDFHNWSYGITDLVTAVAESSSSMIKPTRKDCEVLRSLIVDLSPHVVILLHGKVVEKFLAFLGHSIPPANSGELGKLLEGTSTMFFNIAFPHGNTIRAESKVAQYKTVKKYLLDLYGAV
jgi:hypothetical protein